VDASQRTLALAKRHGVLRPRDLQAHGIARTYLQRLRDQGRLRQVGRGLYVLADADLSPQSNLAAVSRRVPGAVVCLLSALRFPELTTQNPYEIWIAIPTRARAPKLADLPTRVVRMAPAALTAGVGKHRIDGVLVPVFDVEKTVLDCFRYRNRIKPDVALEAIREYLRRPRRNLELLLRGGREFELSWVVVVTAAA
jgi:predicted transcriptional regulator of viral defense system